MKFKKITEAVYYLDNPVNIGVIKCNERVILIDTGLDKRTAKKILTALDKEGLYPQAVINTHAHADHCGGNAHIKEKTGAKIYAAEVENQFIENTFLEPFCFFGGAQPISDLKNKFLQAEPVIVDEVFKADSTVNIQGLELEAVSLPGHSQNHIGIAYQGVLFCGDAIYSQMILDKHQVPFCINISKQKQTLAELAKDNYQFYLPAHGCLTAKKEIKKVATANRELIENIEEYILKITAEEKTTDEIMKKVCREFSYRVSNAYHYYLLKTSVKAYLSYLYNNNLLKHIIKESLLYWQKK